MGPRLVPAPADAAIDRAAYWALREDAGTLDEAERADFEAWLEEPGSASAYASARDALDVFDDLDGIDMIGLEALRKEAQEYRPRRTWLPWLSGGAIAASIAGVLGFTLLQPANKPETRQVAKTEITIPEVVAPAASAAYATAIGEQRVLVLSDGSHVTMNTGTQITVDFRPDRRIVRLARGQALFDVAHNPQRPFSVIAAGRTVTALGTMFEVEIGRGQMHVTLMRGKVVVDPPRSDLTPSGGTAPRPEQAPVYLTPGQQFTVTVQGAPEVRAVDVRRQLLWRQQLVEFDNASVAQAVSELNRYSLKPIIVPDARVGEMRISGVYKTGDSEAFVEMLSTMLPVTARETNRGEIELAPAAASTK